MQKIKVLRITCVVLCFAILITIIWGIINRKNLSQSVYNDGIEQIDLDSIYLVDSGVQVDFSEVII